MLERIEIGNFKAFGDIQTIDIKPLTLLFGGNSSGKSTILQSLIYLSEAIKTSDWNVLTTTQGGHYIDFGGLKNVVHQKDYTKTIHFGFTISGIRIISPVHFKKDSIDFSTDEFRSWFFQNQTQNRLGITTHDLEKNELPYYECTYTFRFGINTNETSELYEQDDRIEYFSITEEDVELIYYSDKSTKRRKIKPDKQIFDIYRDIDLLEKRGKQFSIRVLNPVSRFFLKSYIYNEELDSSHFSQLSSLFKSYKKQKYYEQIIRKKGISPDYDQFLSFWSISDQDEYKDPFFRIFSDELNTINSLIGFGTNVDELKYPLENSCNLSDYLSSIEHIGYFRPVPDRIIYDSKTKEYTDKNLDAIWHKLILDSNLREHVNEYLSEPDKLDMGYELIVQTWKSESKSSGKSRTLKTLEIIDLQTDTIVNLREVGQGVIQLIPILTAILDPQKKIVSIEQPELHLHPALQARLAHIIAEYSHDRELVKEPSSKEKKRLIFKYPIKGKIFLIETHSEHIIKAIQLYFIRSGNFSRKSTLLAIGDSGGYIKSNQLNKENINIIYIKKDHKSHQSTIRRIKLDDTGSLQEPFPDDFFELSADLTLERLKSYYKGTN